jgi:hypothetical protein
MRSNVVGVFVAVALMVLTAGAARADNVYDFTWQSGETCFFKFASADCLAITTTGSDYWEADVDDTNPSSAPITFFDSDAAALHDTGYSIISSTLFAKFVITDVSGSIDFTDRTAAWTITGYVTFSASGYISQSSCKTSSFNVSFSGNYVNPTDSSAFNIPALSGSGTQACGGYSSSLNAAFSLGTSGAKLHFNKFDISPP